MSPEEELELLHNKVTGVILNFRWGNYGFDIIEFTDCDDWAKDLADAIIENGLS